MSIATEITRLNNAKAAIKSAIESKGVTVPQDAKIDLYADYIAQIPQEGSTEYEPICFTSLEDGNTFSLNKKISISVDDKQTWQILAANTPSPVINTGEKIYFKATENALPFSGTTTNYYKFSTAKTCNASGHPYSLYAKGSFYFFPNLFKETKVVDVSGLDLSQDILTSNCYQCMFQSCTSLTVPPELPATTLAYYCYGYMFSGCTSLVTAPELPATTLKEHCYTYMFYGCKSLVTVPELPATTLDSSCYNNMFGGCTYLVTAPELPATTLAVSCYSNMFNGCTSLVTAPELPATKLAKNCYSSMFYGCKSLNYIKALFTTTPSSDYTNQWVSGVASTGTFVKNRAATWTTTGNYAVPTGWTVVKVDA